MTWGAITRKLGLKDQKSIKKACEIAEEKIDRISEQVATFIDERTNPQTSLATAADAAGMSKKDATALNKKMDGQLQNVTAIFKKAKNEEHASRFEDALIRTMEAITPDKLADAKPRDLAIMSGIFAEKMQLMRGLPSQIVQGGERRTINQVLIHMNREAKRRGIELRTDPVTLEGSANPVIEAEVVG